MRRRANLRTGPARRVAGLATAVALAACLVAAPAMAPATKPGNKPPRILPLPVANFNSVNRTVEFSAQILKAKEVTIHYGTHRRPAEQLLIVGGTKKVVKFIWQATFKPATRKKCYGITVVASNRHGTRTRERKACRLGQFPR